MTHPHRFTTQYSSVVVIVAMLLAAMIPASVSRADVCQDGLGIPPFLSAGVDPNLLLVLDNSGSMLDVAYPDDDGACTDNSFDATRNYTGLFDPDKWYYWTNASYFAEVAYNEGAGTFASSIIFDGSVSDVIEYRQDHVVIKVGEKDDPDEPGEKIQAVSAFAASGRLLNWASASKFDIQKEILTGGKYDEINQLLISEGRGCSGRPYIKEVPVHHGSDDKFLTLSVRGYAEAYQSSPDHLTRIAVMGVTDTGFISSDSQTNTQYESCLDAIEEWQKEETNQGQLSGDIIGCLDYGAEKNGFEAYSNSAYNGSVHECWFAKDKRMDYEEYMTSPNISTTANAGACESIYIDGFPPSTIGVTQSGYVCSGNYGLYPGDASYDPETSDPRIYGYTGRCWVPEEPGGGCIQETCTFDSYAVPDESTKGVEACFPDGNLYTCEGSYFWSGDSSCHSRKSGGGDIVAPTPVYTVPGCVPVGGTEAHWIADKNSAELDECLRNALWDFCNGLSIPEEIDPSDPLGPSADTGDAWGLIGSLIDASLQNFFSNQGPIMEMQARIHHPARPSGIIHEVAGDIRIGVMRFNDNGAETECVMEETQEDQTIVKYCPDENYDGARVVVPINNGSSSYTVDGDVFSHVDLLVSEINNTPATSWTPLAEAFYNALGYYGQRSQRRLFDGNSGMTADFYTETEAAGLTGDAARYDWQDPVQYYCQSNYVLIITEGQSTTDINTEVRDLILGMGISDDTVQANQEQQCMDSSNGRLYGSTYFDDMTYYGQHAPVGDLFSTPSETPGQISVDDELHDKQNITTYVVVAGNLDAPTGDECDAATLMTNAADNGGTTLLESDGDDPAQLEENLRAALNDILLRASAGSASSVISSSRSGEGGVYQAVFWPKITRGVGMGDLEWVGDVHAFFIDESGRLWDDYSSNGTVGVGELWSEDENGNGVLDPGEDWYPMNGDERTENGVLDGDRRIITFYNTETGSTQICFNSSVVDTGVCEDSDYFATDETGIELRDFGYYLWSTQNQLAMMTDYDLLQNRGVAEDGKWDFSTLPDRYIFTWNDIDNDGIVDAETEILQFDDSLDTETRISGLDTATAAASPQRNSFSSDFGVTADLLPELVKWIRGIELYEPADDGTFTPYQLNEDLNQNGVRDTIGRCRKEGSCLYSDQGSSNTWRLGDIIHSTPTLVSAPAERYHFPYKDPGYGNFYKKYATRRNVIYFGGNDGMLHAVNAGFPQSGGNIRFSVCGKEDQTDEGACSSGDYPALGAELWAYIPYNLQPHLACLADPGYDHKYYVDATPRIFDVRIFPPDDTHVDGWGTILVGYMRFGGAPTDAHTDPAEDNRKFISSYFILDITDPERPPTLLAEMTGINGTYDHDGDGGTAPVETAFLGYTTPMPTVIPMRNDTGASEWFLILGNGPTTIKGENGQAGKVAVLSLNQLTGYTVSSGGTGNYVSSSKKPFRIPNVELDSSSEDGDFGIFSIESSYDADGAEVVESFTGDLVSIDVDLDTSSIAGVGIPYKGDAVYFGTVDGSGFGDDNDTWVGGGRMFRLLSRFLDSGGDQVFSYPKDWQLRKMFDARAPITAAVNVGFDGSNFWVYAGTGRFFAPEDKTDASQNYFYGVKETMTADCGFTWGEVDWWGRTTDPAADPGERGLLKTDDYRVIERRGSAWSSGEPVFYCEDEDGVNCTSSVPTALPPTTLADSGLTYFGFDDLVSYIKGERCGGSSDDSIGIDGWYREMEDIRERSLGMPTLLGGLVLFTSYQPFADTCLAEGVSYLYGVYYLTGTAWYENVFGTYDNSEGTSIVKDRLSLGVGMATTPSLHVGSGSKGVNAFVQTSTGTILEIEQENLPVYNFKSGSLNWRME